MNERVSKKESSMDTSLKRNMYPENAKPAAFMIPILKLPLLLYRTGLGWLFASFVGAFTPGNQAAEMSVFWTWALGAAALGCAYPIGLFFALRSAQVRAYYNSISTG